MIYHYTIYPLEVLLETTFVVLIGFSGSHFLAIILLAIIVQLALKPIVTFVNRSGARQREIEFALNPQIENIRQSITGQSQHEALKRLYSRYSYHPIYAVRSLLDLFVQLPFFIAAYFMLSNFTGLSGVMVPVLGDLGVPDTLLFGKMPLMPFVVTGVNILAILTTPDFGRKNVILRVLISFLFFALLYEAPLALLVYWTTTNLFSLFSNLIRRVNLNASKSLTGASLTRIFEEYGYLFLITNLALLIPLLGVLGDQFNLFTSHGMTGASVSSLMLIIMLVPTMVLVAIRWLTKLILLVWLFDAFVLFLFLGTYITYLFNKVGYGLLPSKLEPYLLFVGAAIVTLFVVRTILKSGFQRSMAYFSLLIPLFYLHFIYASAASTLFADRSSSSSKVAVGIDTTPVFVLVFDEFSGLTLQNSKGELDAKRYPGFAKLASHGDYFPNALTVNDFTAIAVPSLVSGNLRGKGNMGLAPHGNLLDEFNEHSTLHAYSPILPAELSFKQKTNYYSVISDLLTLHLHIIFHQNWIEKQIGSIPDTWNGFGIFCKDASPAGYTEERNVHLKKYFEWLSVLEDSSLESQFNFMHIQFPHAIYNTTSLGKHQTISGQILAKFIGPLRKRAAIDRADFVVKQSLANVTFHNYMQQSAYTDYLLQELVRVLEEKGLFEDSLIIVTADHGVSFDVEGLSRRAPRNELSWANILSIPLFIKYPHQESGSVNTSYVTLLDIAATIYPAIGETIPWGSVGENLKLLEHGSATKSVELIPLYEDHFENIEALFRDARDKKVALFDEALPVAEVSVNYTENRLLSSLLGTNVADLPHGSISDLTIALVEPITPEELSYFGTVSESESLRSDAILAAAVNGKVQAVFESGKILTQEGFFAFSLPEFRYTPSTQDVSFYEVEGDSPAVLRSIEDLSISKKRQMRASPSLTQAESIDIYLIPSIVSDGKPLKRIGVRIGTHKTRHSGDAELVLTRQDGTERRESFPLPSLTDNRYLHFDLQGEIIIKGKIRALSGKGISAWESHDEDGLITTCIIYEFIDGTRKFTPGCPTL